MTHEPSPARRASDTPRGHGRAADGIHEWVRLAEVPPGTLDQDPGISLYRPAVVPRGHRLLDVERRLGRGRAVFDRTVRGLAAWEMHRLSGIDVGDPAGGPARPADLGVRVRLRPRRGPAALARVTAPCLVVGLVDHPGVEWGFAYATLPGHPESGEESFVVTRDERTDEVRVRICAVSRPASRLARLAGLVGRLEQDRMTGRYLAAFRDLAA